MSDLSPEQRTSNLEKLKTEKFDILVIGGGITGAGVARDAAMRGLKVALIESKDFAYGTSSRSSKLIHGGIRYLENLEFQLVFEALSERSKLFEICPHLVHPLRFMIPLFKDSRVGMFKMGLGMALYDLLSLYQAPELHERLNKIETLKRMPIVRGSDLIGSFVYSDAYMDDDRIVHETLRSAHQHQAVIANYVEAVKAEYHEGRIKKIVVKDQINKTTFSITADHVVGSVGPWTDILGQRLFNDWKKILRPTKGIHITLPKERLNLSSAVVMAAQKSNRIVFAIPRHEMIIIGTTDTDFQDAPEKALADPDDIKYLLRITNEYFPGSNLKVEDIYSSYVGVRPLVHDGSENEGKTSREHTIISDPRGMTLVAGGKYTTYRLMSEQIVDTALKSFSRERRLELNKCSTHQSLNNWTTIEAYEKSLADAKGALESKLAERYGLECLEIMKKYDTSLSYWQIEALQAIDTTMCLNLVDFYSRRVPLMLVYKDHGLQFLDDITKVFKDRLSWSDEEAFQHQNDLKFYIDSELAWQKVLI